MAFGRLLHNNAYLLQKFKRSTAKRQIPPRLELQGLRRESNNGHIVVLDYCTTVSFSNELEHNKLSGHITGTIKLSGHISGTVVTLCNKKTNVKMLSI